MIVHVDMDAFYASVEQRDRPELAGLPVIVGGLPEQRGVVAAASYEVRRYGVHSAMSSARAKRLCPQAVFVAPRLSHYAAVSAGLRAIFDRYTPLVEPLSLDEAFLDVGASERLFGPAPVIAERIRADIRAELRLTASVGVAVNKFLAKLASDEDKPDGLTVIAPGDEQAFLDPLPVERIWGVGRVAAARLHALGVRHIADLRRMPVATLTSALGAGGRHLHELAHGQDDRPVVAEHEARQLSHEMTFAEDIRARLPLRAHLLGLVEELGARLRRVGVRAGVLTVKLRFDDFSTVTRSRRLTPPGDATDLLWQVAGQLLDEGRRRGGALRLIGVAAGELAPATHDQGDLFAAADAGARGVPGAVDGLTDAVRERFGSGALRRAGSMRGVS